MGSEIVEGMEVYLTFKLTLRIFLMFCSKVMEQCENFKEDPMETNHGQEVNYGQRG